MKLKRTLGSRPFVHCPESVESHHPMCITIDDDSPTTQHSPVSSFHTSMIDHCGDVTDNGSVQAKCEAISTYFSMMAGHIGDDKTEGEVMARRQQTEPTIEARHAEHELFRRQRIRYYESNCNGNKAPISGGLEQKEGNVEEGRNIVVVQRSSVDC